MQHIPYNMDLENICNDVVISCSHNIHGKRIRDLDKEEQKDYLSKGKKKSDFLEGFDHQRYIDELTRQEAEAYKKRGSRCISYKFKRVYNSKLDELKFLAPITTFLDIPVCSLQIVDYAVKGMHVSVVGSEEVKEVVDSVREVLKSENKYSDIDFVKEGANIAENISNGAKNSRGRSFFFVPGDIPFALDLESRMKNNNLDRYFLSLDLNSKEKIFEDVPEFFQRNFYHIVDGDHIKEPNVFGFKKNFNFNVALDLYNTRQGGGLTVPKIARLFLKYAPIQAARLLFSKNKKEIFDMMYDFTVSKKNNEKFTVSVSSSLCEELGYILTGKPIEVKLENKNPWNMWDIDARHDLHSYQMIFDEVTKKGRHKKDIKKILSNYDLYLKLDDKIRTVKDRIALLSNFIEHENERADMQQRKKPYDKDGKLMVDVPYGFNVKQAVKDLEMRKNIY